MLVLTRRIGESVLIADRTIEIKVLSVSKRNNGEGGAVCLGFEAPKDIDITRNELTTKKKDDE